jgi:hypothetical protein
VTSQEDVVAALLVAEGLAVRPSAGTANNWPVAIGSMPTGGSLNNYIAVYGTGADQDGRLHRTQERVEYPTFQVMVRGTDYPTGRNKAKAIVAYFDSISSLAPEGVTVDAVSIEVYAVHVITTVTPVGEEENNKRWLFSVNAKITFKEV